MKTERRHELQHNELADWVGNSVETVKPYAKVVLGLVFAVLVIVAFVAYFSSQTKRRQEEGWDGYFRALNTRSVYVWEEMSGNASAEELKQKAISQFQSTAEQYRGTTVGSWARIELADVQIVDGMEAMFRDRAEANDLLRSAQQNYSIVADDPSAGDIPRQRALLGLARACEALNELDRARDTYERILRDFPDSAYTNEAKLRLEDLDRPSTKDFYDWFNAQDPQPPTDVLQDSPFRGLGSPPGAPGASGDVSLDDLLRDLDVSTDGAPATPEDGSAPSDVDLNLLPSGEPDDSSAAPDDAPATDTRPSEEAAPSDASGSQP